jgi:hypothetical protein
MAICRVAFSLNSAKILMLASEMKGFSGSCRLGIGHSDPVHRYPNWRLAIKAAQWLP